MTARMGALGSIGGTLAAGFLFLSWIGSLGTVVAVAAAYALTGGLFILILKATTRVGPAGASLMVAGVLILAVIGHSVRAFENPCLTESDYYCIRVVDFEPETGRPSALMVLDHLGHGINDRDDPGPRWSGCLFYS